MVKQLHIVLGAILVVAVAIVAAVALFAFNPGGGSGTPTPVPGQSAVAKPVTAFQALWASENNSSVTGLKAGSTNAYAVDIASETCTDGLSTSWTVTYRIGGQQALVRVDNGAVADIRTITGGTSSPRIATAGQMDSDAADALAEYALALANQHASGRASVEFMAGGNGAQVWDFIYPVRNGSYLVRLNATDGSVVASTPLGA